MSFQDSDAVKLAEAGAASMSASTVVALLVGALSLVMLGGLVLRWRRLRRDREQWSKLPPTWRPDGSSRPTIGHGRTFRSIAEWQRSLDR